MTKKKAKRGDKSKKKKVVVEKAGKKNVEESDRTSARLALMKYLIQNTVFAREDTADEKI